jgi:protein-S-isoprenylcysteine O-methyltransferase Ste14
LPDNNESDAREDNMSEPTPGSEPEHAGVIVPPPLIYAVVLALALGIDLLVDGPRFGLPRPATWLAGGVFFLAGLLLTIAAASRFRSAGTDVRPWKETTALVTEGLYRYTRNPMYLGMTLIYVAFSLLADSVIALAFVLLLLVIITYAVIRREEHYLEVKFGEKYRRYKERVRRWL